MHDTPFLDAGKALQYAQTRTVGLVETYHRMCEMV